MAVLTTTARQRRGFSRVARENVEGYLFVMPWLVGFVVFTAGPMIASFYFAFTRYRAVSPPQWIGLDNFQRMIGDRYFWIALKNTAYYTFLGVPAFLLTAFAVALALNTKVHGMSIYRTIYYLPSIVPTVATAILWVWIFNPDYGFANVLMRTLHLPTQKWLGDPALAKPCLPGRCRM